MFFSVYAYLGTRLLVPRIGESNVTIIGFAGSSIGLAIFAIGAFSGNQFLAFTCAALLSMSGMVQLPFICSYGVVLKKVMFYNIFVPLTSCRFSRQFVPSYRAVAIAICKVPFRRRWGSCLHSLPQ
jgi:hypothetical protein